MSEGVVDFRERITSDPAVMVGKPVIRGTRIPVERIIGHLAHNPDLEDLFGACPELTLEDVKAALAYAQAVIERGPARRRRALEAAVANAECGVSPTIAPA